MLSFFFFEERLIFELIMTDNVHQIGKDVKIVGNTSIMTVSGMSLAEGTAKKPFIDTPADSIELSNNTKPWALWGDSDNFPQELMKTLDKLGVAKRALDLNSDLHYGSGIQWMKEQVSAEGKLTHIISNPKDWRRWSFLSGFNKALSDVILSGDTFNLGVVRVVMSATKGVHSCECLDTPSVRLGKRDKKGKIKQVFYAQNIHLKNGIEDDIIKYPLFHGGDIKAFAMNNPVFCIAISNLTWGRFYYGEPNYYATFRNGWSDIAIAVPNLIKNIYKNQATLKYHIEIPYSYFLTTYKDWQSKEEKDQLDLISAYKTELENVISNAEASGKSAISIFDDTNGFKNVVVTPIDNKLNAIADLPNNTAANSEILFAIGIDPSLLGLNMPGGKDLNGGGGSQRRESLKIKQLTLTRERLLSMEFVWAIGILNGYAQDIYPMYVDIDVSQTLDENPTGKKTVVGGA